MNQETDKRRTCTRDVPTSDIFDTYAVLINIFVVHFSHFRREMMHLKSGHYCSVPHPL
jgi:hypothetical protein